MYSCSTNKSWYIKPLNPDNHVKPGIHAQPYIKVKVSSDLKADVWLDKKGLHANVEGGIIPYIFVSGTIKFS